MFAPRRSTAPGDADGATLTDGIKVSRLAKKQDSDLDVEKSGVEKLMAVFKQGLFGVLFVMAKDASVHHSWHYVLVFFHFLQLMSFPLSASNDLPWQHQPILRWLCQFLTSLSLTKRVLGNRTLSTVACFCGLGWICGLLACAFWVGRAFIRENFVVLWPIKVLRMVATLSTTLMFIPLVAAAMQVYVCEVTWGSTGLVCFSGVHMLFTILTTVVLAVFIPFALIVVMCFFDRDPKSHNFLSMPHSRVETVMIGLKAVLTFVFTLESTFHGTFMVLVVAVAAGVHVFVYLHYLPFYQPFANQLHTVFATVFAWGSLCLLVAQFRVGSGDELEGFMFLSALPSVVYAGYALAKSRIKSFDDDVMLSSVFMVEIKARRLLSGLARHASAHDSVFQFNPAVKQHGESHGDENESENQLLIFKDVDALYSAALDYFSDSALLHVFVAQYLNAYRSNRHLELVHIAAAETKEPAIDATFLLYQRRQQIRQEESSSGSGSMSLMARIKFEQAKAESEENGLKAEFWKELASVQPSLSKLDSLGWEYDEASRSADEAYKLMLQLNPQAVSIIRKYAQFLVEVSNNSNKARKLLTEADSIEDSLRSSLKMNTDAAVILMAKMGVVQVSQAESVLGTIHSLNPAAIKMFGYSRRDVVGKGLAKVLPDAMAEHFQLRLRRFLFTGEEDALQTTRVVIGRHSNGFGFPMLMSIKPLEDTFACLMQKMPLRDQYILTSTKSFKVLSGSEESLAMLGVPPAEVNAGTVSLLKFLDETQLEALVREADAVLNAKEVGKEVMLRRKVEFHNVSRRFLDAMSGPAGTAFEFKSRKSSNSSSGTKAALAVWFRLQTTDLALHPEEEDKTHSSSFHDLQDDSSPMSRSVTDSVDAPDRLALITWSQLKEGEKEVGEAAKKDALRRRNSTSVYGASGQLPDSSQISVSRSVKRGSVSFGSKGPKAPPNIFGEGIAAPVPTELTRRPSVRIILPEEHEDKEEEAGSMSDIPAVDFDGAVMNEKRSSKVFPVEDAGMAGIADTQSVGTKASSHSVVRFHAALEFGDKMEEKSLSFLRKALFYASLVAVAVGLAAFVSTHVLSSAQLHQVDLVQLEGQRMAATIHVYSELLTMRLISLGNTSTHEQLYNDTLAEFKAALLDLTTADSVLSISSPPKSQEQINLFTVTQFPVVQSDAAVATTTLNDLAAQFISSSHVVGEYTIAQVRVGAADPVIAFVLNNGETLFSGYNQSTTLRYDARTKEIKSLSITAWALSGATAAVLVLEMIAVILPIALKIGNEKHQMFSLFMKVPVVVISRLSTRCQQIYDARRVQRNNDSDVNGEEEGEGEGSDNLPDAFDIDWSDVDFSRPSGRNLKRDVKWPIALFGRLSWPLLVAAGMFAGFVFSSLVTDKQVALQQQGVLLAGDRLALMLSIRTELVLAVASQNSAEYESHRLNVGLLGDEFQRIERLLYVGTPEGMAGVLGITADESNLVLGDGCVGVSDATQCADMDYGILTQGLHGALLTWRRQVVAYGNSLRPSSGSPNVLLSPTERITSDEWQALEALSDVLIEGLTYSLSLRVKLIQSLQDSVTVRLNAFIALFAVILVLCNAVVYRPIIRQLDMAMKRNRGMLLLFPEDVVHSVTAIATLMKEYAKSSARIV